MILLYNPNLSYESNLENIRAFRNWWCYKFHTITKVKVISKNYFKIKCSCGREWDSDSGD